MPRRCPDCSRTNPKDAAYCYFDGKPLEGASAGADGGSVNFGMWAFPSPFVFPSGETCRNFLQLALACQRDPREASDVLSQGYLEKFFGSLGRIDLVVAASAAAKAPDKERGLDELLGKMPGSPLQPPELHAEPARKDFGVVPFGEDRRFDLVLENKKDRLLYGKATVENCPWLGLGDGGAPEKLFQCFDKTTLRVRLVGKRLRAFDKPQKAEIVLETNGGNVTIVVEVTVPVKPFPEGVLSGATSPRQLAAKAKAQPKEAAVLIENGAVARWYEANGWTYPVQGPTASGYAAVQQLFETLGLVKPPKVELSEPSVSLRGKPGQRLEYVLTVVTHEKRAAVAYGTSDQPWLSVGRSVFKGQTATIPLTVEAVPSNPGSTLTASVKVTANGNQRFDVPVTLAVGDGPTGRSGVRGGAPASILAPAAAPAPKSVLAPAPMDAPPANAFADLDAPPAPAPAPVPAPATAFAGVTAAASAVAPAPVPVPVPVPPRVGGGSALWVRLLPVGLVFAGLLTAVSRDLLFREVDTPMPEIDYDNPVLEVKFHDTAQPNDAAMVLPLTMRFGLGLPDPADKKTFKTKLTYDPYGRTCNVAVRVGKDPKKPDFEYQWGVEQGVWKVPMRQDVGKDLKGNRLPGATATWVHTVGPTITITQHVEIVPGGLSPEGTKRLLDTCLVYYDITNDDPQPQSVGLRFLLDTYIGSNDAVPFTIAGARELCNTMKEFNKPEDIPDYISALEKQELNNPGVVAHLTLKYADLERPSRVTLGAWPVDTLADKPGGAKAAGIKTGWDVPVLPMAMATSAENPQGDSAVTLYWEPKEIQPKTTRRVGFAYGLGKVAGDSGDGQLGMTAGGEVEAGKVFTLTAYVKNPAPGAILTLTPPKGVELVEGKKEEAVPPLPTGSSSPFSPVTWKVKADRGGVYTINLSLNSGAKLRYKLAVPEKQFLH